MLFSSYKKYLSIAKDWNITNLKAFAMSRIQKECYYAFQSLEYAATRFTRPTARYHLLLFGFGLGTSWALRLIQQSILKKPYCRSWKKRQTAVFPKLVFTIKKGLNFKTLIMTLSSWL